jgi:hypothetical protein
LGFFITSSLVWDFMDTSIHAMVAASRIKRQRETIARIPMAAGFHDPLVRISPIALPRDRFRSMMPADQP